MNNQNKLIVISSVHGTGKSTILNLIRKRINWKKSIERATNPFQTTFSSYVNALTRF